ncbi:MAG: phosphatase PAP2 family protein [Bryobacteraceae bacterium]|nr:phosphatase PAP2 family protein [Bryobacteraceae bacterium]
MLIPFSNPLPCGRSRNLPFFRSYEYILIVFFCYTTVLGLALPVDPAIRWLMPLTNAVVLGGLALAAYADSFRRGRLLGIMRDWYAPPMALLAYREIGWLAQPQQTTHREEAWLIVDRLLLDQAGLRTAIESLGPVLPSALDISYTLVYAMLPFSLAMLYVYHRRERVESLLFNFLLAVLSAYTVFPLFPSEPPWTVFPEQDYPAYDTVFRRLNEAMLRSQGIHTAVFPSTHVSGSFSVAFAIMRLLPERRWVGRLLLTVAILIAVATIYGRYHYAVDAVAGLSVAGAATAVSIWREGRAGAPTSSRSWR